jgi:AraC family transcriptional regulator
VDPRYTRELGRSVARGPAYVAGAFKSIYGTSIGEYVRGTRLWHARRDLDAGTYDTLADVAHRYGFADQSHFARLFKRSFEIAPGDYGRRRTTASTYGNSSAKRS